MRWQSAAKPTITSFRSIHAKSMHINEEKNVQSTIFVYYVFPLNFIQYSTFILIEWTASEWVTNKFSKLNRNVYLSHFQNTIEKRIMQNECCSGDSSLTLSQTHKHHPSNKWRISWCYECFNYAHVRRRNDGKNSNHRTSFVPLVRSFCIVSIHL